MGSDTIVNIYHLSLGTPLPTLKVTGIFALINQRKTFVMGIDFKYNYLSLMGERFAYSCGLLSS